MGRILAALLVVFPVLSLADATVPETRAGHALGAWLVAFNSGDRVRQEAFIKVNPSWGTVDDMAHWSASVGGYELLEIYPVDPANVFFRVKQKSWAVEEVGRLQVRATGPADVTAFELWRLPAGAKFEPLLLDDAARTQVVDRVAALLVELHVDPQTGKKLAAILRKHAARGAYRALPYGEEFARKLTADLREVGHDKHLEVRFSYVIQPAGMPTRSPEEQARQLAAVNCGFEKVEHLPPNVGYVKFNFFAELQFCAPTAGSAMTQVADSDALILDLRDNNGGRGEMVEFIASYLFAQRTHLGDVFIRSENVTQESWTLPDVPGKRFVDKPVFVLMSQRTFSAGEGLSYALKDLKRATLIGETTAGGSGTIAFKPVDAHFTLVLPTGHVISPVTRTDFARTGVIPDVKVPADQALDVALKLAVEKVGANRPN